jgi:putative hemolysin
MTENGHSRYPVCRNGLDDVVGVIQAQDLLVPLSRGEMPDLGALMQAPVFVPETLSGMELLDHFRATVPSWCSWSTNTARCRA